MLLFALSLPRTAEAGDPAMRARVLANIAKSKQARESSGFRQWSQAASNGFRNLRRPQPKPRISMNGPSPVPHNYVVRGGGGQPSVLFDKGERRLKRNIRRKAAKLRMNTQMKPWEKIERLQKIIKQKVKHAGNELDVKKNPNKYNKYNKKISSSGGLAQLGDYLKMHKVVCREMAHITQVALQDAGFESRLVYGVVKKKSTGKRLGGHAWNEVKLGDKWRIVDTTNPQFNKVDPKVATTEGTKNGWLWSKDTWGPRVVPKESYRSNPFGWF